jgi:hypothetical protein
MNMGSHKQGQTEHTSRFWNCWQGILHVKEKIPVDEQGAGMRWLWYTIMQSALL